MLGHLHQAVAIAVCGLILAGCGGSEGASKSTPPPAPKVQKKEAEKRPMSYYESTLRPSMYDGPVDSVRRVHEQERERQTLDIPKDSLVLEEESILGFRIQVASSSNIDDAAAVKVAAQGLFTTDTVYVVYDPPVYKVRVGDFITRLDANQRLPQVQESGYPDAWIVPDKVVRRRWIPVAKP